MFTREILMICPKFESLGVTSSPSTETNFGGSAPEKFFPATPLVCLFYLRSSDVVLLLG